MSKGPIRVFWNALAYGSQRYLNQNLRSFKWERHPSSPATEATRPCFAKDGRFSIRGREAAGKLIIVLHTKLMFNFFQANVVIQLI